MELESLLKRAMNLPQDRIQIPACLSALNLSHVKTIVPAFPSLIYQYLASLLFLILTNNIHVKKKANSTTLKWFLKKKKKEYVLGLIFHFILE